MLSPSTRTSPPSTPMLPQMMLRSEVLPEPLLPTMETNWPSGTVREKPSKSRCSVAEPG